MDQRWSSGGAGSEYADLARLRQDGFAFSFDPAAVRLVFEPTVAQKVEGNISVNTRQDPVDSPNRADPAGFAAFLNLRSGAMEILPVRNLQEAQPALFG